MRVHFAAVLFLSVFIPMAAQKPAGELRMYMIDTEGGHATLFISPSGESLLMDAGFGGDRDAGRILDVMQEAGVKQLDYMVLSHQDGDHFGGMKQIASKVPVRNFIDHGPRFGTPNAGFQADFEAVFSKLNYRAVKPGDKLPFRDLDVLVVTSANEVLKKPLPGAGKPNPECAHWEDRDAEDDENAYSVGLLVTLGKFRTINLGDFTWNSEKALMCPNNPIGSIDLYQTSHHGTVRSGSPALVHGLRPRVAIMNNGFTKGGDAKAFEILQTSPGFEDLWQLHWSTWAGLDNAPSRFIANVETPETAANIILHPPTPGPPTGEVPRSAAGKAALAAFNANRPARGGGGRGGQVAHSPAYYIKVTAKADGEFTMTNQRNGFSKTYQAGR
jgi:beta-lactamase superfamily II metal-dependent hydrolase